MFHKYSINKSDFDFLLSLDKRGIFPSINISLDQWILESRLIEKKDLDSRFLNDACLVTDDFFGVSPLWAKVISDNSISFFSAAYFDPHENLIFINRKSCSFFGYDETLVLAHELCHLSRSVFDYDMFDEFLAYMVQGSLFRQFLGMVFSNIFISFSWAVSWIGIIFFQNSFYYLLILSSFWSLFFISQYFFRYKAFYKCYRNLVKRFNNEQLARWILFRLTKKEALSLCYRNFEDLFDGTARWIIIVEYISRLEGKKDL